MIKTVICDSIYLKPSSYTTDTGWKRINIYDQDMKRIKMPECDVVDFKFENYSHSVSIENLNGALHFFVRDGAEFELTILINTLIIKVIKGG